MHRRCKSWHKPIHAHKGNSLWARLDSYRKTFVIVRAHFCGTLFSSIPEVLWDSFEQKLKKSAAWLHFPLEGAIIKVTKKEFWRYPMELSINIGNLLSRYDLETSIDLAKQAGFTAMDYSLMDMVKDDAPFNGDNYLELAHAVRALADAKGFPVNQTHAPFSFGSKLWGDPEYYQNVILPRMIRSIEISGILGAKVIVIHPLHHITYHGNEETLFRMNMDYYRSLIPYAAKAGVKIGV